jgi:hypothetical protein
MYFVLHFRGCSAVVPRKALGARKRTSKGRFLSHSVEVWGYAPLGGGASPKDSTKRYMHSVQRLLHVRHHCSTPPVSMATSKWCTVPPMVDESVPMNLASRTPAICRGPARLGGMAATGCCAGLPCLDAGLSPVGDFGTFDYPVRRPARRCLGRRHTGERGCTYTVTAASGVCGASAEHHKKQGTQGVHLAAGCSQQDHAFGFWITSNVQPIAVALLHADVAIVGAPEMPLFPLRVYFYVGALLDIGFRMSCATAAQQASP